MISLNKKILIFSAVLILTVPLASFWYYKKNHPRYVPPALRPEITITIIPGWNLRQVAEYLVKQGLASTTEDVFAFTGKPAYDYRLPAGQAGLVASPLPQIEDLKILKGKPKLASYEGYLAPETYRVFADASILDVLKKLVEQREKEITAEMRSDIKKFDRSFHEIMIMASILEKEVQHPSDKAKVADVLWRRYDKNWALQVDSSVHYAVDKTGDVFTTDKERAVDSQWNTYKYPGLPLGPISNPGVDSILAAINPEKNNYWYFLTGKDGAVYYGKTLEEHNANKRKL